MRYLIQTYVEEAGATAVSAADGAVAIERVRAVQQEGRPFDGIVLDMQMPVMDGFRAAPALRAAGHTGLIVALTANAMKGDAERCLAVGCDHYLSKPVDRLHLLHILAGGSARALEGAAPGVQRRSAPRREAEGYRRGVLIVDDNQDATELLSMLLDGHGLEVVTAKTGAEAVERALALRPQVVVLDLGLPDMDGYAVLEHLKAVEDLRSTRFIALSGRSSSEDQQRMREAGFHHQLVKPADLERLIELIKGAP
jgi:two-component system, chemotaxis family, CheB/CheR fusion protein